MKIEKGEAAPVGAEDGPTDPALSVEQQTEFTSQTDEEQAKPLSEQQHSGYSDHLNDAPVAEALIGRLRREDITRRIKDEFAGIDRTVALAPPENRLKAFTVRSREVADWIEKQLITKTVAVDLMREIGLAHDLSEEQIQGSLAASIADPFDAAAFRRELDEKLARRGNRHDATKINGGEPIVTLDCLADIDAKPVVWLWEGRLARGKVTLLSGDPGMGKSQIAIDIAARISTESAWFDGGQAPHGSIIILSAEDAASDTIKPRLEAAGADAEKIFILKIEAKGGGHRTFNIAADLDPVRAKLAELGDVDLVIIDPVTSYMGKIDSHRTTDVRAVLEPLADFAEAMDLAVLAISHPPKASQTKAINAVTGSLAFVAAARIALVATEEPGTNRRLLLSVKNNLGPAAAGLGYHILPRKLPSGISTSVIEWDAATVHLTADDVLAASGESGGAMREAREFLADVLVDGPLPSDTVAEMAKARGISQRTLERARKPLGVVSRKDAFKGGWTLSLPSKDAK